MIDRRWRTRKNEPDGFLPQSSLEFKVLGKSSLSNFMSSFIGTEAIHKGPKKRVQKASLTL